MKKRLTSLVHLEHFSLYQQITYCLYLALVLLTYSYILNIINLILTRKMSTYLMIIYNCLCNNSTVKKKVYLPLLSPSLSLSLSLSLSVSIFLTQAQPTGALEYGRISAERCPPHTHTKSIRVLTWNHPMVRLYS